MPGRLEPFPARFVVCRNVRFRYCEMALRLLFLILVGCAAHPGAAQPLPARLSDEAQLSLVTVGPGDDLYSLFGHTAIRVADPVQDLDVSFNYGTFDFGNPLTFAPRFAYGKLDYFLSVNSFPHAAEYYWLVEERPVVEQVLNLSPGQEQAIYDFLLINLRPENRTYRYNFLFDNCSTRPRDVLTGVLGDSLRLDAPPATETTFRALLDPYLAATPFLDFGIDLLLGTPADRVATPREATFLPDHLAVLFDHAEVSVDGAWQPLVAPMDTLFGAGVPSESAALPLPSILLWLLLAVGVAMSVREWRQPRSGRRPFDAAVFAFAGIVGVLIVFLWFISEHTVTARNVNLLWAWPTHLLAAWAFLRNRPPRWLSGYVLAAALAAGATLVLWPVWPYLHPAVAPLLLLIVVRGAVLFVGRKRPQPVVS